MPTPLDPGTPPGPQHAGAASPAETAEGLLASVPALVADGRAADALRAAERAAALRPELQGAHLARATALMALARWDDALAAIAAELARFPEEREALDVRAAVEAHLARAPGATARGSIEAGRAWPKVSVVTPCRNCERFVERSIESVLAQRYPHVEHIVADGASTDGTVAILRRHPHLAWRSEPDRGEAEALNKALRRATGDVVLWLNADDVLMPGAFDAALGVLDPARDRHLVYGKALVVDEEERVRGVAFPQPSFDTEVLARWWRHHNLCQPGIFHTRRLVEDVGLFREDLYFSIDLEYWFRIAARGYAFHFVDRFLAKARLVRSDAKSGGSRVDQEESWLAVSLPFVSALPEYRRFAFWREYYAYRIGARAAYGARPIPRPVDAAAARALVAVMRDARDPRAALATLEEFRGALPADEAEFVREEVSNR